MTNQIESKAWIEIGSDAINRPLEEAVNIDGSVLNLVGSKDKPDVFQQSESINQVSSEENTSRVNLLGDWEDSRKAEWGYKF